MNSLTTLTPVLAVALLYLPACFGEIDAPKQNESQKQSGRRASLGIYVSSVPRIMSTNMPEILADGQGLVVDEVAIGSPAAKAGIRVMDILSRYDDQKLYSREQLAKLLRGDRPGRDVSISYVRDGKPYTTHLVLAEAPTLRELGNNQFHAEFDFTDKAGNRKKSTSDGTREQIRDSIRASKEIVPAEQAQILRTLHLPSATDEVRISFSSGFRPNSSSVYLQSADNNLSLLVHYSEQAASVPKTTTEEHIDEVERQLGALKREYGRLNISPNSQTAADTHAMAVIANISRVLNQLAELRRSLESGDVSAERMHESLKAAWADLKAAESEHYQFQLRCQSQVVPPQNPQFVQPGQPVQPIPQVVRPWYPQPWYPHGMDPNGPSYDPSQY